MRRVGGRARARRRRGGFIFLFGARGIVASDGQPGVEFDCPSCRQRAVFNGKIQRTWFTFFFIPIFPISKGQPITQCSHCNARFRLTLDQIRNAQEHNEQGQNQQAIALYNSLRASPANSITLNNLMLMYAGMREFQQAISAAEQFPDALNSSEQCMSTLGRVLLANNQHAGAIQWFDAALARNDQFGEAAYYKGVAMLTSTPPDLSGAATAARTARKAVFPNADVLLKEIEERARQASAARSTPV